VEIQVPGGEDEGRTLGFSDGDDGLFGGAFGGGFVAVLRLVFVALKDDLALRLWMVWVSWLRSCRFLRSGE
jgi:hypothetical protein